METRRFLAASCLALGTLAALGAGAPVRAQGLPDMIVDTVTLQQNWLVRDENLPADACSVIEGGVTPGVHRIIRFTVTTPNVGTADVYVGNPADHIAANDGLFEFATCHQHYHFRNYAKYELIDPQTGQVWKAAKRGFCMLDTDPVPASGLCHNFAESDYTNNIGEILITIPDHPGRSGYGPLAGAKVINPEPPEH